MHITIHIGIQKTGSTSIQTYLNVNRRHFAAQGVAVLGKVKELWKPGIRIPSFSFEDISRTYSQAIISNENLYTGQFSKLRKSLRAVDSAQLPKHLKNELEQYATSWRILCYVRRPSEHIVSVYQQMVKARFAGTLNDFYEDCLNSDYYRYAFQMERWVEVFGEGAVDVRVFHPKTLRGSPSEDFVRWTGIDPETLPPDEQGPSNESLDRVNVALLHFHNRCKIEAPDLLRKHAHLQKKKLISALRAFDTGERLRLDAERATRLHEQFREDHELLAMRHLSPEHAAVLLAPVSDAPPPPPLDRETLYTRMMAVFNDPDLADLAVEKAEHSTNLPWKPEDPAARRDARPRHARREAKQQARKTKRAARLNGLKEIIPR
jgi:hypothetical protein